MESELSDHIETMSCETILWERPRGWMVIERDVKWS